ncbi:hypothetical protein IPM19_03190 [bacterium]|nr:MAG: hypothetical protein IPM19_03190 [bacterium]
MVLTSLPVAVVSVSAQTRRQSTRTQSNEAMGPYVQTVVGTSEYYSDDSVFFRSRKVFVSRVDLQIGASPQVRGGLRTAPGIDEEDVKLERRILVATMTSANNIYMGYLSPVVNGQQIYVRRKIATKQIIAIINCGNWTRQLGSDYSFQECDKTPGPCIPGEMTTKTEMATEEDGSPVTIVTSSDGCTTRIERTIVRTKIETKIEKETEYVKECVPGAWLDVYEHGNFNGKLGKSFKVAEVIGGLPGELQSAIVAQVTKEKVNYLMIQQGACENERTRIKVRWFTKSGGWNWVSFLVGTAVGAAVVYFIKRSDKARKTNTVQQPPRGTTFTGGSTGSDGNPTGSGSGLGTVPTRPRRP